MINIKELFKQMVASEKKFHYFVVDLFAKEYGWSVEYIQSLTLPEIVGLTKAIRERKDNEDVLNQVNIAKGMNGKISSNRQKPKKLDPSQDLKNLKVLARFLGKKIKTIKE